MNNTNRPAIETAVFAYENPTPCATVARVDGLSVPYVTYTMPAFVSRALGKGCVSRTLGVPATSPVPVIVCVRYSPDENWIGVWDGVADATEAARIAATFAKAGR